MKRKRGNAKNKSNLAHVSNIDDIVQRIVRENAPERGFDDDFEVRGSTVNSSRGGLPLSNGAEHVQDEISPQNDQELEDSLTVIKAVMRMDAATPFNLPVDPDALGMPDYFDVIESPMDFSTICYNLENGLKYQNSKDVYRDVQYIWENCTKYNKKGHYILELMKRVREKLMVLWTGFGLCTNQQPDINEHLLVPRRNSSARKMEVSRSQRHLGQPSVNCSQTQEKSRQHIPSSGRQLFSQSAAEPDIANAGNYVHQQHHQPSCSYGHTYHPLPETCSGMLSSRKRPTNSFKPHAGIEMRNAEKEFRSPPLSGSMIRYTKRGPSKYPPGHMADDSQLPDPKAASSLKPHQPILNCGEMERRGLNQSSRQVHATSEEPYADVDMDSSDEFLSPPRTESMISCAKRGPTTDPADEISPNEISKGQPQIAPVVNGKVKKKNRGRGPTRCLDVWSSEDRIHVSTNESGDPVGPDAPKFIFFLGTVARNGLIAPLNYINWKAVPDENKEKIWQLIEAKFLVDPQSKDTILKSVGTKWKNWKALVKRKHYTPHETDEERLADCNDRVQPDQWRILVSFWNSTEAKDRSNTNKANRLKFTSNHACGSKSFARVREEQRMKRPEGKEPSQADLFIVTRTRKNGEAVNEASSVIISQLRDAAQQLGTSEKDTISDDVVVQVMGEETPGRVRTPGVGPILSSLRASKPLPVEAVRLVSAANAEVREMKEKMVIMEQSCAQMASQIATMMTMMQKKFSNNDTPDGNGSSDQFLSSSSHGVPSLQRTRTRSGKKQSTSTAR